MADQLPEDTLANILVKKLEHSSELKEDIAHYYRQDEDHPDHSYTYLRGIMNRCLRRRLQKTRRDEEIEVLRGKKKGKATDATPGPTAGKGSKGGGHGASGASTTGTNPKPKAKAKSKSRSRSKSREPKSREKGGGKGRSKSQPPPGQRRPCYYHNHGGCNKSAKDCPYEHRTLSKADADKLERPRSASRPGKEGKGKGKGKGKGGKGKGKGKSDKDKGKGNHNDQVSWCKAFLTQAGCPNTTCSKPHLPEGVVEEIKRAHAQKKGNGRKS